MRRTLGTMLVMAAMGAMPIATRGDEASPDKAKQILLRSREAVSKTKAVRYQADYKATGYVKQWVKDVRGTVLIGEKAKFDVPRYFLDVTMAGEEGAEPTRRTIGCDGNEYYIINESTKMVHADLDPAVLGRNSRSFQRVVLPEFGDDEAFKDALESKSMECADAESVEGEDCDVVVIKGDSPVETRWWISKKDNLPRRVLRLYKDEEDGEGTTELTLGALTVNPPIHDDPFRVRVPEGYSKTDEFAQ